MGRTVWTSAVAFAAGIAVGFAARGCDVDEPARPGSAERTHDAAPADAGSLGAPRPARRPLPDESASKASEVESAPRAPALADLGPDVREIPLEGAPTSFAEISVEVVDPDRKPVPDAEVYALAVGAPGAEDTDLVAHASTSEEGRCTVAVPIPGNYDVAARTGLAHARVEAVHVGGGVSVSIQLPPSEVAVFVLDPDHPPARDVKFSVASVADPPSHYLSARGERCRFVGGSGVVGLDHPRVELPLGSDEYEVTEAPTVVVLKGVRTEVPAELPAVFEPKRFVPPATIRVRAPDAAGRFLEVRLLLVDRDDRVFRDRRIECLLEADGGTVEVVGWSRWNAGNPGEVRARVPVCASTGSLRWSGPTLVAGQAEWDLDRSPVLEATADLRPTPPAEGIRVFVDLSPERAQEDGAVVLFRAASWDPSDCARTLVPVRTDVVLDAPLEWLLVDVDRDDGPVQRRVAGPARARAGERLVLEPMSGGYVVFAPRDGPPASAGRAVLARSDGAPFAYAQGGDDHHGCRAALPAGAVLGPFEPGAVTLDVFVAGRHLGRYEVTVREGTWTTFAPRVGR